MSSNATDTARAIVERIRNGPRCASEMDNPTLPPQIIDEWVAMLVPAIEEQRVRLVEANNALLERARAAERALDEYLHNEGQGHADPCIYGSLCPYCEIASERARREAAGKERDNLRGEVAELLARLDAAAFGATQVNAEIAALRAEADEVRRQWGVYIEVREKEIANLKAQLAYEENAGRVARGERQAWQSESERLSQRVRELEAQATAAKAEAINNARRVARKALDYYYQNFEKDGPFDEGTTWQDMVRETVEDCRAVVLVEIDKLAEPQPAERPPLPAPTWGLSGNVKVLPPPPAPQPSEPPRARVCPGCPFTCKVLAVGKTDPPQDCDWPFCGCDEHASTVLAALGEMGLELTYPLRRKPSEPAPPTPTQQEPSVDLEAWRAAAFALCRARGWSENWTHRLAAHVLEASEYVEAWRGKKGDAVEEAGDMLLTALVMIPETISLAGVYAANRTKIAGLMVKPPYAGEERTPAEVEGPQRPAHVCGQCPTEFCPACAMGLEG